MVAAVSGAIGLLTMAWLFYSGHCLVGLIVLIPFLALVLCSAVAALAYLLAWKWLPAWRENGYGICSGKSKPSWTVPSKPSSSPAADELSAPGGCASLIGNRCDVPRAPSVLVADTMAITGPELSRDRSSACHGTSPHRYGQEESALEALSGGASLVGPTSVDGWTPWIHRVVQTAAGRSIEDDPLTFGELWYPPNGKPPEGTDTPRAIELSMITSDISRNRAAQLPFLESPSRLYVEEEMLKRYFPTPVVAWMCKRQGDYGDNVERRAGVFRLPLPEDLPLVFAARLSLSFAVLLSAVPLLTPDYANKLPDSPIKLRDVWFSDGGLTSNFPIHFFDSPIPSRPTFCLNLVDFDAGLVAEPTPQPEQATAKDATEKKEAQTDTERDASKPIAQSRSSERRAEKRPTYDISERDPEPRDAVWKLVAMARRNEMSPAPFTSFDAGAGSGLFSFVMNLINTARFWSDNQMLMAPGTRDRVVHIGLRDDEGGLNLDMPANTIAELNRRGRAAGMLIAARFDLKGTRDPETGMDISPAFPNHRWVRYRNFMAGFERMAAQFRQARRKADMEAQGRGEPQIDDMLAGRANKLIGYRPPASAQRYYRGATNALMRFADGLDAARKANKSATFDPSGKSPAGGAPRPRMRLRQRPVADGDPRA